MRAAARFKPYNTSRLTDEELEKLGLGQLATEHHLPALVGAVRMKYVLGDIQTDCGNRATRTPPSVVLQHLHFGT